MSFFSSFRVRNKGRRRWAGGKSRSHTRPSRQRSLRLEPLEQRQLLALASGVGNGVSYHAASGEINDVVLSPGEIFSIQDAPDVQQRCAGGFVSSGFISGLGFSLGVSLAPSVDAGANAGIGAEAHASAGVSWGISFGVGIPLVPIKLPAGVIGPSPKLMDLSTGRVLTGCFESAIQQASRGVASVVAGAEVPEGQKGKVYYSVEAANGSLDEYRLFQAVVDPNTSTPEMSAFNGEFARAQSIVPGKLVEGDFGVAPTKDTDFYKFEVKQADVGKQFVVIVDSDPGKVLSDQDVENDDQAARLEMQVLFSGFDYDGLAPSVSLLGKYPFG